MAESGPVVQVSIRSPSQHMSIAGPAGMLQCVIDTPSAQPKAVVVIAHPNPQLGGTLDNKVVQTIVRAFLQMGYRTVRFNFRGVGSSEGQCSGGPGEVADALAVIAAHRGEGLPLALAGFSFGAYVMACAADRLSQRFETGRIERLLLIGPSTQKQLVPVVPDNTLVVHGELDDVVPLQYTLDWARPQNLPVMVVPGGGHFFHGQLTLLKNLLVRYWGC
jgi:uncharacterized protein